MFKNKKNTRLRFSFEIHSFKHLYNNYSFYDLIDYAIYLQTIYFNVHLRDFYIRSADKSCLVRSILDIESSLIKLTYKGGEC